MGANAVTTVPVYVAGEVLTAADLNITNSGIPVFASSVERDAAFGGTGEKTLAEGQYAFLEDTNATQFYDGATWQPVGTPPGLVCVKAETAFSAVASLTVDSIFTSTYTNYKIVMQVEQSANTNVLLNFRAATVDASTNYNYELANIDGTALSASRNISQTAAAVVGSSGGGGGVIGSNIEIYGPQIAAATQLFATNSAPFTASYYLINLIGANHSTATAYDGFKLSVASGTMTGSYTIYGYSKAV
jgi:hypothetical protein